MGVRVYGRRVSSDCLGRQLKLQKKMNNLLGGLRRPPINDNTHTNQPKTGADNGEEEGEEARPLGSGGGVYIHR